VCNARTKLAKVQFELNLNITELELKAKPLTPPEVKENREAAIQDAVAIVDVVVKDLTTLFEQSHKVVTSLQEDPNIQRLEIKVREL